MDQALDIAIKAMLEDHRGDWPEIAKRADVSHSWLSKFVRGDIGNPGYSTLKKVQAAIVSLAQHPAEAR